MLATKQDIINVIKNDKQFINEYIEFDEYIFFNFKNCNHSSYDKFFYQFKFNHPVHGIVNMDKWDGRFFDIFFSINNKKNKYIILKTTILELNLKYCNIYNDNDNDALGVWIKEFLDDFKPNKKTEKAYTNKFNFIRTYFSPLGPKFNKYLISTPQAILE
jgi:hypothetical protein